MTLKPGWFQSVDVIIISVTHPDSNLGVYAVLRGVESVVTAPAKSAPLFE